MTQTTTITATSFIWNKKSTLTHYMKNKNNINIEPPSCKYFSFSDSNSAKNNGTFCLASISRCFKSNSTDSSLALLMKVVAIPVLPERPVLPILCTKF